MRLVVIGAGLGGLSAACHLAGPGHDVVVLVPGVGEPMLLLSGRLAADRVEAHAA